MNREQLLSIIEELQGVLRRYEATLQEAETIGEMLLANVRKNNETSIKEYTKNGRF